MTKLVTFAAASAALVFSCVSAVALESTYKNVATDPADVMWKKIGDFCGIATWHPAVAKCELSHGNKIRTLTLNGGGTIVERLLRWDNKGYSYTYTIVSSPLPVSHYFSTIKVVPDGLVSQVIWTGKYRAKGASNADAQKTIDGIYKAGLDKLTH